MSVVSYNGVTLPYAFTTDYSQRAIMDDSQTDKIYTEFDIRVQGLLNFEYLNIIAPELIGKTTNPAEISNWITTKLLQPRKRLSFKVNDVEMIPYYTQNFMLGDVDAKNGPVPQSCTLTHLTNTTFLLSYRIVANYAMNMQPTNGSTSPLIINKPVNVLMNRWTETVDIDAQNYTKRTREGKFIIASNNQTGQIVALFSEQMANLGIPDGFLRESSRYTVSPDGLSMSYVIVDKEVFKTPPKPAFEATGTYTERSPRLNNMRTMEARVRLKGDKLTSQTRLLEVAMAVVTSKVMINAGLTVGPTSVSPAGIELGGDVANPFNTIAGFGISSLFVPTPASTNQLRRGLPTTIINLDVGVTVDMYNNEVDAFMVAAVRASRNMFKGTQTQFGVGELDSTRKTFTPYSSVESPITPNYLMWGSASLLLKAASYYDPSLGGRLDGETDQMTRGVEPGRAGRFGEASA